MNNPETRSIEEKVHLATIMPEPSQEFASGLWKQIERRPRKPAPKYTLFGQFFLRPAWQAVVLILLVALGTFLLTRPQPVSAQEILRKAQLAATDWVAGGVQSFEMISETTTAADVPGAVPGQVEPSGQVHSRLHTWFQTPERWRYEMTFLSLPGREPVPTPAVTVTDGRSVWSYDPQMNLLQIHDGNLIGPGKGGGISLYGAASGLGELMANAGECFYPVLAGRGEIVAGRKTYQLNLGPSRCPSVAAAAFNGPQTLWIDQETFFILKWETRDLINQRVIRVMEVTEIRYNPPLSADLFTFTPPPGAQVLDERGSAQKDESTPLPTQTSVASPIPEILVQPSATPFPQASISIPYLPTPEQPLGGGTVQDGPFTFNLRLYRDPRLSANPVAPSLYSDLEGIGIYAVWGYQGPDLPAPVTVSWGVEPSVAALLQQAQYTQDGVQAGDSDGLSGGILLPAGGQAGDVVRAILKIETDQKTYGAVMSFTLKEGSQGLEPADVSVQLLDPNQEP